jgi:hypothetical protein
MSELCYFQKKFKRYGHDPEQRSVPIPEGQAGLYQVGLTAIGCVSHGAEVAPV